MAVSDLDLLAQSVRRALDRIDGLEAEKRRLLTDNSILDARLKKGPSGRASSPTGMPGRRIDEVRDRLEKLIVRMRDFEEAR